MMSFHYLPLLLLNYCLIIVCHLVAFYLGGVTGFGYDAPF